MVRSDQRVGFELCTVLLLYHCTKFIRGTSSRSVNGGIHGIEGLFSWTPCLSMGDGVCFVSHTKVMRRDMGTFTVTGSQKVFYRQP